MSAGFARAMEVVLAGGCLIYPTETLYALGGDGRVAEVAARVFALKNRDLAKPLPLVLGHADQLPLVTDAAPEGLALLAGRFWPGPLSVLVPARADLPPQVSDARGLCSVRVTPHPLAARLCRESGAPLVATSANVSGGPAAAAPGDLDPGLAARVDAVLDERPWPAGGPPSTVVALLGGDVLAVYRSGAVSDEALREAGFEPRPVRP